MTTEGQAWALEQLYDIARSSGNALEIVAVTDPAEPGKPLEISLSVDCRRHRHKDGGVQLRPRERLRLVVPARFPFARPNVHFTHKSYQDVPHVQWGDQICLYQAPDVEWQPSDGIAGFIERLDAWLAAAAANELDPIDMPLHPPVAYSQSTYAVVPRHDTPTPEQHYWCGYVEITHRSGIVAELGHWHDYTGTPPAGRLASVVLLAGTMPHEYPATIFDLVTTLLARGVSLATIKGTVNLGVLSTPHGEPALILLGAAMRGIAGAQRRQHLACWRIPAENADNLRDAAIADTDEAFYAWAATANVEWCRVLEERPEIVERRDGTSQAHSWHGKHVAILGCGAIGSGLAVMLARAGVARLQLYDNAIVTPGILVRQNFPRVHVGYGKTSSLKLTVEGANPDVAVSAQALDITALFDDEQRTAALLEADAIVDATASTTVATALERHFRQKSEAHPPIFSICLGHNADMAMMTMAVDGGRGLSVDLDRRSRLMLARTPGGHTFLNEFWPTNAARRELFQPEPGCSSPTFRGSFADVLALVAPMSNVAGAWLALTADVRKSAFFAIDRATPARPSRPREIVHWFEPPDVLTDPRHGFEIRLDRAARAAMLAWIRRSERTHGSDIETGGILIGAFDPFLKIAWIDEVTGPPPDSVASAGGFVCGTAGVAQLLEARQKRFGTTLAFVGMWHTHPRALPVASPTDLGAMNQLLANDEHYLGRRFLMLIVGGDAQRPIVSANVFQRDDYGR